MSSKKPAVYIAGDMTTDVFVYEGKRKRIDAPVEDGTVLFSTVGAVGWIAKLFRAWADSDIVDVTFPKALRVALETEKESGDPRVKPRVYYRMSKQCDTDFRDFWRHVNSYIDHHPDMIGAKDEIRRSLEGATTKRNCFSIWRCQSPDGELGYGRDTKEEATRLFCPADRGHPITDNSSLVLYDQGKHIGDYGLDTGSPHFPRFGKLKSVVLRFTDPTTKLRNILRSSKVAFKVAIISTRDLREAVGNRSISVGLSWERTVADLLDALRNHDDLVWLNERVEKDNVHLIVQIGNEGALHIFRENGDERRSLHFAMDSLEGDSWNTRINGIVPGCRECLVASVALSIMREESDCELPRAVERGIVGGLKAAQKLNLVGHQMVGERDGLGRAEIEVNIGTEAVSSEIRRATIPVAQRPSHEWDELDKARATDEMRIPEGIRDFMRGKYGVVLQAHDETSVREPISDKVRRIVVQGRPFTVIRRRDRLDLYDDDHMGLGCCNASGKIDREWRIAGRTWHRVEDSVTLATSFARRGFRALGSAIGADEIPFQRIGRFLSIDRKEIERLRILRSLINDYEQLKAPKTPLSVAVFGASGSGKSFAVRELAGEVIGTESSDDILIRNLSQLDCPHGLISVFHEVRDRVLKGRTPLVFWDEFDSGGYEWLQHFLAPMQDGEFRRDQLLHPIGKCVFVFAGSSCHSFTDFDAMRSDEEFKALKGPDFISRLSGYLDVMGPNSCNDTDYCWPLRRAVLLRSVLRCGEEADLKIDDDLLRALLKTARYEYGSRSLEKITESFAGRIDMGEKIRLSDLPPEETMRLHIDYNDFMAHVDNKEQACA
jgi:hypothetical protein